VALTQRTNRLNYTRRRRGCRWGRTTLHLPGACTEPSVACPQAGLVLGAARARHGPTRARPRGRRAGRRARELHVEGVRVGQVRRARPGGTRGRPARRAAPLSFFVPPARAPRRGRLRYGEMWGDVGRYGEIWGDMGRYDLLGLRVEDTARQTAPPYRRPLVICLDPLPSGRRLPAPPRLTRAPPSARRRVAAAAARGAAAAASEPCEGRARGRVEDVSWTCAGGGGGRAHGGGLRGGRFCGGGAAARTRVWLLQPRAARQPARGSRLGG